MWRWCELQASRMAMKKTATIPIEASPNVRYSTCCDFLCVSDDQNIVLVHDYGRRNGET